jgi:GTPase
VRDSFILLDSGIEKRSMDSEVTTNGVKTTYAGFVAIIGKPNVGKSTLLNTMLGIKVAPISPKPQTTRKGVRGIYTWEDKQLVFIDTPGLHRPKDALGDYMNREVRNATSDVEAILWVVDLRRPPSDEDKDVARLLEGLEPGTPVYLIGNKADVAKYPDEAINLYKDLYPEVERVYTLSALNDPQAVYALREDLFKLLPESPFFFPEDIRSDQSREQWAAELVRESVMIMLREELPYTVAVQVLEWREATSPNTKNGDPLYISAEIWVEKSNHRMIVLGKGGKMIKEIGQYARKQLEVFLQQKVFLDLHVEVHSDWRQDAEALRELGYEN